MKENRFFITGTGTNVGKTLVSMLLCKKFGFKYCKPIQSGSAFGTDFDYISSMGIEIFQPSYNLLAPLSPNIAAKYEKIDIDAQKIKIPDCENLIVEGAGGIFVPINNEFLMTYIPKKFNLETIIVAKGGLGVINSTLLTIAALKAEKLPIRGVIFNCASDDEIASIMQFCDVKNLGRIDHISCLNTDNIAHDINL
ncbi:dethiobiotin synthase [Candidatus Deianiraea vastatrix]|uniref:ATP-dependent dethiobiotin synthetase BioD n=1 Tax=Candidatus Deianiraea vastatrix TaxID=2163644 RepID=A0A5B8XE73_9RICK|nr:dethiobiotin synthase [Candidatus Deianiraea vastatrix]QED23175.1 ATP-dependent dethiobiotin synthetase BioD [Candidatus Deianiraea vastatrix]